MTKYLLILMLSAAAASCSQISYVAKQGVGQVSLEWNGRDNKEVLEDESVAFSHKEKIRLIGKYKKFFYDYFDKEPTGIYDETTFLNDPAVTYLVIASPANEIKALQHKFPFVGSFPYLGFFDLKDAKAFERKQQKEGMETYLRPVYAYSTLNQWIFDDNILSSFFGYSELELAELIFHELFHTVFFVKSEVALNENMAQYFSRELVFEYFKYSKLEKEKYIVRKEKDKQLTRQIVALTLKLQEEYVTAGRAPSKAEGIRTRFMREVFEPEMTKVCKELELEKCWPLEKNWNNARFAAFLTYEAGQNKIEAFAQKNFPDLKSFLAYLIKKSENYKGGDGESFEEFILGLPENTNSQES